jgi:hypothetical protein
LPQDGLQQLFTNFFARMNGNGGDPAIGMFEAVMAAAN